MAQETTFSDSADSNSSTILPVTPSLSAFQFKTNVFHAVLTAVLSTILLFLFLILAHLILTRCRARRKKRKLSDAESFFEVQEARKMKRHDRDFMYPNQGMEDSSLAGYSQLGKGPTSPVTSLVNPLPLYSRRAYHSLSMAQDNRSPPPNPPSLSHQPTRRHLSTPVQFSLNSFTWQNSKRPDSPTVGTDILSPRSMTPLNQNLAPAIMISSARSSISLSASSPSQDISLSQFPHPGAPPLTHSSQLQRIFWTSTPAATEHAQAFALHEVVPSSGLPSIPQPVLSRSKRSPHRYVESHLKLPRSVSEIKGNYSVERTLEMKRRSKFVAEGTVAAIISKLDELSRERERRGRIEGWLDTPDWGEGSLRSAGAEEAQSIDDGEGMKQSSWRSS